MFQCPECEETVDPSKPQQVICLLLLYYLNMLTHF